MNRNFFGKTAVHVSGPYSKELSCKKSRKSFERFARKSGNQQTNPPTVRTLTSADVENYHRTDSMGPASTKSQV